MIKQMRSEHFNEIGQEPPRFDSILVISASVGNHVYKVRVEWKEDRKMV